MKVPAKTDFRFFHQLVPRWGDMDSLAHVNNVKFFTYDESARLEYFNQLMGAGSKLWTEYGFILAHIEADFLAQLRLPASLDIGFRVARLGKRSFSTEAGMFRGDEVVAVTRGVLVWFDYANNRTLPVPEDVRALIRAFEAVPPEE